MTERSAASKVVHEVLPEIAEHDAWFRQQVEAAVLKADSPHARWTDHNEVKRTFAQKRAELAKSTGAELEANDHRVAG